jgi:hypothetical protein
LPLPPQDGATIVKAVFAAAVLPLLLGGCVPTMELRPGDERERMLGVARAYCAAELSADPYDTAPLFDASIRSMMEEVSFEENSAAAAAARAGAGTCEPGRSWYRGGSRTFIDIDRGEHKERLDFWRGSWPLIHDVLYRSPRRVEGRTVRGLRHALMEMTRLASAVPPPPLPDRACVPEFYNFAFLATDTQIYRQGATVKLVPSINMQPAGTRELPVRCTSGWSVSGPAVLSADRTALTIAADAPVGALVTVAFTHQGKPVKAQFQVIGRDEVVLTGRYSQSSLQGCQVSDPVGELEFSPGSRFSVTFRPFESYRDYWGRYSFDPATRRMALTVEGGNFVPEGLDLEGEAELAAGRLVLKGMFLGSKSGPGQQGCTYTF